MMSDDIVQNCISGGKTQFLLNKLREFAVGSCPGRQYPSQWSLAHKYGVSRSTVEKVFKILEAEGAAEKKKGAGAFIPGRKKIHFFMPGADILTRMDSNGFTVRERLEGCMKCASERGTGIELMYLSPNDNAMEMDLKSIADLNKSSMIVLQDWFFTAFPQIAEMSLRCALISSGNIRYGSGQHIKQFQQHFIDRPGGIRRAMEILYASGCRKIAMAGHYINYCRGLEYEEYCRFAETHNMDKAVIELDSRPDSYSGVWQQEIAQMYEGTGFDGLLLFCREYFAVRNSIHEYFKISPDVKIMAWNFFQELAPGIEPLPCFNPPNRRIGYEAVSQLMDDCGRCRKTIYQVEFKNLTEEMQYHFNKEAKQNEVH